MPWSSWGYVPLSPALSNSSCSVAAPGRFGSWPITNRSTPRTARARMPESSTRRTSERTTAGSEKGIATTTSVTRCRSATASTSDSRPSTGRALRNAPTLAGSSSTKPTSSTPRAPDWARSRLIESPCSPAPAIRIRCVECATQRAAAVGCRVCRRLARRLTSPTCQRRKARTPIQENSVSSTIKRTVDNARGTCHTHRAVSSVANNRTLQVVSAAASWKLM